MNKYESVIILNPELTEENEEKQVNKIEELIKANGTLENTERLGKKKLAYEIRKQNEGIYYLFEFESDPDFIKELERIYRITDEIMKFIVVRKDD